MSSISNVYHDYSSFLNATTFSQVYQNFNQLDNLNVLKNYGGHIIIIWPMIYLLLDYYFLTHEIFILVDVYHGL